MKELTDEEIMEAWDNAFDKDIYFDHKPTPEGILLVRIKAVLKEVDDREYRQNEKASRTRNSKVTETMQTRKD